MFDQPLPLMVSILLLVLVGVVTTMTTPLLLNAVVRGGAELGGLQPAPAAEAGRGA